MGCSYTGVKPRKGGSPAVLGPKKEVSPASAAAAQSSRGLGGALSTAARVVLGSLAGFYYFVLPVYMWLKNLVWPKGDADRQVVQTRFSSSLSLARPSPRTLLSWVYKSPLFYFLRENDCCSPVIAIPSWNDSGGRGRMGVGARKKNMCAR